jgi:hypothetical protein
MVMDMTQAVDWNYATSLNTVPSLRKVSGFKNTAVHVLKFLQAFVALEDTNYLRLTETVSRRPQYEDL